jgi:hypothetical protein
MELYSNDFSFFTKSSLFFQNMSAAVHEDFALGEGLGRVINSASPRLCRVAVAI